MKKNYCFYILILFFISTFSIQAAINTTYTNIDDNKTDYEIVSILNNLKQMKFKTFQDKIAYINQLFFNKPYAFNALGEGELGEFDDNPIYRTDAFDCETYVDTIIALALAKDLPDFTNIIKKVRYKDGNVSFTDRNHFTCLDWNINNQNQKITKDISNDIRDKNNNFITEKAKAYIDKPNWYKNLPITRIRQKNLDEDAKNKKLADLRAKGVNFKKVLSTIDYIPFDKIFSADDEVDMKIIKQIPNGAIVEIIRPNWDLNKIIGTNLNVSHLGFVVWEKNTPYFIHASTDKLIVTKTPFIEYLKKAKESPTIKGINVQIIIYN